MTRDIDLGKLSHAEKDALIRSLLPLVGQLQAALVRIAELEARLAKLERPAKTPDNSSLAPSTGQKPDVPAGGKPPRKGRPGVARALEPNPDRITDAKLEACPHCAAAWPDAPQTPQMVYDRIELPPVRPDVTRVRLFGGRCACCGERAMAPAPDGRSWQRFRRRSRWNGNGGLSQARHSVARSRRWWFTCTTPRQSASSGCGC